MLSVVILTFNSQKYLADVLQSADFADEIVVVDSGSTDETFKIATSFKNVTFIHQDWLGFGQQKQFGVNCAKNDWIFVLDSDEVITDELKMEIKQVLKKPNFKAYFVARLNYFFNKPIKTMGLYPDFSIRFFNRNYACFSDDGVHEKVICECKIGKLKNHFIHHAYESVEQFIAKQNLYSSLGAKQNKIKAIFNPFWTFFRLFILKGGWREGYVGYVISRLYSQYTFWKYIK